MIPDSNFDTTAFLEALGYTLTEVREYDSNASEHHIAWKYTKDELEVIIYPYCSIHIIKDGKYIDDFGWDEETDWGLFVQDCFKAEVRRKRIELLEVGTFESIYNPLFKKWSETPPELPYVLDEEYAKWLEYEKQYKNRVEKKAQESLADNLHPAYPIEYLQAQDEPPADMFFDDEDTTPDDDPAGRYSNS